MLIKYTVRNIVHLDNFYYYNYKKYCYLAFSLETTNLFFATTIFLFQSVICFKYYA